MQANYATTHLSDPSTERLLLIETNLVGWHSRIIGTPSHLSKSCLLIIFLTVKCTNLKS
jgi:hypothetical protein